MLKTKKLVSILLVAVMFVSMFSIGVSAQGLDDYYDWKNQNLTNASAAYTVGPYRIDISLKSQHTMTDQDLKDLIDSYSDEFLLNAEGFVLTYGYALTDISYVFEKMPNLKVIDIYGCFGVSDLSGVENCTQLEFLAVSLCALESIEPIRNLTNLFHVDVSFNKISDISLLSNLPNLIEVDVRVNHISDMTPLMREKPYDLLLLGSNFMTDIEFLKGINLSDKKYTRYVFVANGSTQENARLELAACDLSTYDAELAHLKETKYNGEYQDFEYKKYQKNPKAVGTMFCQSQEVDKFNRTITITSNVNADFVVLYQYFDDIKFELSTLWDNVEMYSNYRYKISKPADSDTFIVTNFWVGVTNNDFTRRQYTLIVKFVSKEVSISQDEIRPLYADNAVVDNDAGTITLNSVEGRNYFDLYNIGLNKGVTFSLPEDDCVDLYSAYRYKITKPQNSNQYTSKITVTTKDGTREYDFIANFIQKPITISENEFRMIYTSETSIVDNEAGTITLSAKEGLDYLALYNIGTTNGVTFTIDEDDCVDKYSTYRYKITKPVDSDTYTSKITVATKDGTRDYDLIVNFTVKQITISASEFKMLYTPETPIVDNTAKTITLTSKSGLDYLALYNVGTTNGVTFSIAEDDCVDHYSTYRYKITKPVDSNAYTSKITVTTTNGTAVYDLIVNFI